jgi:HAD superfamily hydrolase (TIGR01509 family)
MNKIKAILFDMDGVLIDAKEWHYEALNHALGHFNINIDRKSHLHTFDGLPTNKKLEILSEKIGLDKSLYPIINEQKQAYTMRIVENICVPTPSHTLALKCLKESGYKMAVCSNSIRPTIELMMKKSKLSEYFEFYVSSQDVKKPKPNPEMYLKAINKLKLLATECMIIEDNENGIIAAKRSGAWVMKVDTIHDVNYENIIKHLQIFEKI